MNLSSKDYVEMLLAWGDLVNEAVRSATITVPDSDDTTDDVNLYVLLSNISMYDLVFDLMSPTAKFLMFLAQQNLGVSKTILPPERGYSSFTVTSLFYDCVDFRKAKYAVKKAAYEKHGILLGG